jgi:hypothetical protein
VRQLVRQQPPPRRCLGAIAARAEDDVAPAGERECGGLPRRVRRGAVRVYADVAEAMAEPRLEVGARRRIERPPLRSRRPLHRARVRPPHSGPDGEGHSTRHPLTPPARARTRARSRRPQRRRRWSR